MSIESTQTGLRAAIDQKSRCFTERFKMELRDLSSFTEDALEWLMLEHFQFSRANPEFLAKSAGAAERLSIKGVAAELQRNFREEDGHAAIYKRALAEIGSPVESRSEFPPTSAFLRQIGQLTGNAASQVLGAMYATETAAIFEHEVFWDISREVCLRRRIDWEATTIKRFHDMHLQGVEQSHKDELGIFIDPFDSPDASRDGEPIDGAQVLAGAEAAIDAMTVWWSALISQARSRPETRNAAVQCRTEQVVQNRMRSGSSQTEQSTRNPQ